jgi:hypothetical protein
MRRTLAVLICLTLLAPACATAPASSRRVAHPPEISRPDRELLTTYLKRLPIGSRVRASLADGRTVRGTLMQAGDGGIVVQRRTRIPEPPTDIPIDRISAVELESLSNTGRTVAIGVASGAGAALGVFLLLVAMLAD